MPETPVNANLVPEFLKFLSEISLKKLELFLIFGTVIFVPTFFAIYANGGPTEVVNWIRASATRKRFTKNMTTRCEQKIKKLPQSDMEACKKIMQNFKGKTFQWNVVVLNFTNIKSKQSFDAIVDSTGAELGLSENSITSIKNSALADTADRVVQDFSGSFITEGDVKIHVGGYSVSKLIGINGADEFYDFHIAMNHMKLENIYALTANSRMLLENWDASDEAALKDIGQNVDNMPTDVDSGLWKIFFEHSAYQELKEHLASK